MAGSWVLRDVVKCQAEDCCEGILLDTVNIYGQWTLSKAAHPSQRRWASQDQLTATKSKD